MNVLASSHYRFFRLVLVLALSFIYSHPIFSNDLNSKIAQSNIEYPQWFTGPILTPNPITLSPGHPGLELELSFSETYGFYDSQGKLNRTSTMLGIQPLFDFQMGFNNVLGIELIGSVLSNSSGGVSSVYPADSIFRLGFQISTDKEDSWIPDSRILIQETFPTGRYQESNPNKNGTDITGEGTFQTGIEFVFQKLFFAKAKHPLRLRGCIGYFVPAPVVVRGFNYYGGSTTAKGTVFPGKYITGFLYGEFALTRTWAIACELNYQQGEKGRYRIDRGEKIVIPSFNEIWVLPEIQHTFSENCAMVIGGWFTPSGRNTSAFSKFFCAALVIF